ncbi:MAG: serine--tRNA ligase [Candidatus Veblenbacteria bacterium]|nr:serine--tRNA ligase [Candidatus Veblenbacteria bacterium]
MLDLKYIREHAKEVEQGIAAKGVKADVAVILKLDEQRRELQTKVDELRKQQKVYGAEDREAGKENKVKLKGGEEELDQVIQKLEATLLGLPNLPRPDVKVGKSEEDNEVVRTVGEKPKFSFKVRDYLELAKLHDLIDTERAAKVSGSRFGYLKNEAALLEFALLQYGLAVTSEHGFTPIIPPVFVGEKAMAAMGYLEHGGQDETYHFEKDKLYLVGTSEQSVGAMHMDETFTLKELPRRYVGFSTCFRREAGSYGKDTKGILRVHQFDKLEMVVFTTPEESDTEHERLLAIQEQLMQGLKLPYQVIKMCTADLGDPAARKYDIEAWIPSENKYRETHSCSTTTDFQARRLNTRFKNAEGKPEFVHMLNGTVFSMNRPIIAILENYQQADGTINIPEVLQPYLGGKKVIGD